MSKHLVYQEEGLVNMGNSGFSFFAAFVRVLDTHLERADSIKWSAPLNLIDTPVATFIFQLP